MTAAVEMDFGEEEGMEGERQEGYDWEREVQRPKSGVGSAFMNMANSIIGAGIIGWSHSFLKLSQFGSSGISIGRVSMEGSYGAGDRLARKRGRRERSLAG